MKKTDSGEQETGVGFLKKLLLFKLAIVVLIVIIVMVLMGTV
jgi:hypothetical protein